MAVVDKRRGARLPHWTLEGASYFVTFRTADSLPRHLVVQYRNEIKHEEDLLRRKLGRDLTVREISEIRWKTAGRAERYLDQGLGECLPARPGVAEIIRDTLFHFDRARYGLHAWCVMPNHVHVVVQPYGEHKLSQIILSWKTWSARHANELLKRDGRFWQREYYDRIVRCPLSHEGTVRYVLNNPAKAGLHGWQFMGSSEVDYSSIAWLGTQT